VGVIEERLKSSSLEGTWCFGMIVVLAMKLSLCTLAQLAVVASASVVSYRAPIYDKSTQFSLKVNDVDQKTINYAGYDYVQLDLDEGNTYTYRITALTQSSITSYTISPKKIPIKATVNGNQLVFTASKAHYLIIKINNLKEIVIMADPTETDKPPSSGTGIFNVMNYGADSTGQSVTKGIQNAIDAAGKSPGSIVYVPAGVYSVGNLVLRSDTSLYLAGGSVLRNTGKPSDYINHYNKTGLLPGTWWISTDFRSKNIKLYGRGTIDGNGHEMRVNNKFIAEMVVPVDTTHFIYDGPLIRDSSFWALVPTQSTDVAIKNSKILNRVNDFYENDGIDVVESKNVRVFRSISIARDDSYSTKTWPDDTGTTVPFPNKPMPLSDVVFSDCLAWTECYGYKIGQGTYEQQSNIVFKDSSIYKAAVGIGIDHKFGTSLVNDVTFYNIDIERLWSNAHGKATWIAIFVEKSGVGPIRDVKVNQINVYDQGAKGGFLMGYDDSSKVSNVELWNIFMSGSTTSAKTLKAMNILYTDFSENINVH